jgi:hypothetical protein
MADRRAARPALLLAVLAGLLLPAVFPTVTAASSGRPFSVDHVAIADAPPGAGEDCVDDPDAHPGVGLQKCETAFSLATLLPFVAGGVVVLLAIAVGWYLVMRRRASRPFLPDEGVAAAEGVGAGAGRGASVAGAGWWTCKNCGATNMTDSARCYKCGSWPR